jgi:hypothetical protein
MPRCQRAEQLQVHHRRRDSGSDLDNAIVLCQPCHQDASTHAEPGMSPAPFSDKTWLRAYPWARYQCECTSDCPGGLTSSAAAGPGPSLAHA